MSRAPKTRGNTEPLTSQFEGTVGAGGEIILPARLLSELVIGSGARVHVRVTAGGSRHMQALRSKGVTDGEVDRITGMQMTERSRVIRCLLAEGRLKGRSGFGRAGGPAGRLRRRRVGMGKRRDGSGR